jgi:hypothetical protein
MCVRGRGNVCVYLRKVYESRREILEAQKIMIIFIKLGTIVCFMFEKYDEIALVRLICWL